MKLRPLVLSPLLVLLACGGLAVRDSNGGSPITWRELDAATLAGARRDHRLVLLSVQASWCHFCHVMNEQTYTDARVRAVIASSFVAVRVEADDRPDIAERWRDYGWPATVVLAPDATEIVALRGYQEATPFATLLETLAHEQSTGTLRPRVAPPTPPAAGSEELAVIRAHVEGQLVATWDAREAGWGVPQKYPFGAPVRYALARCEAGEREPWDDEARRALDAYAHLSDPVWGGLYQYSTGSVWTQPHYEKIATVQADALRTFSAAFARSHEARDHDVAEHVAHFVTTLLTSPDGTFYASMDADLRRPDGTTVDGAQYYARDDAGRRALGLPRIDTHAYADVNGELATGLVALADATGEDVWTERASNAVVQIESTHAGQRGGLTHDARSATPSSTPMYLRDHVQMLRASLALFSATGRPEWRTHALALAAFMRDELSTESSALAARTRDDHAVGVFASRQTPFVENALAAEAFVRLGLVTGDASWRELATRIVRAMASPRLLAAQGRMVGEYLLALDALLVPRIHVTIVGVAGDARTVALQRGARALGSTRTVIERADPGATDYGSPPVPSAFLCTETTCSSPVTDPARLPEVLAEVAAR